MRTYNKIVKKHINNYEKVLIKKDGYYLLKGTKLYHGTINKFNIHSNITYFGLDNNISLWYILNRDIERWLQDLVTDYNLLVKFSIKIKNQINKS